MSLTKLANTPATELLSLLNYTEYRRGQAQEKFAESQRYQGREVAQAKLTLDKWSQRVRVLEAELERRLDQFTEES